MLKYNYSVKKAKGTEFSRDRKSHRLFPKVYQFWLPVERSRFPLLSRPTIIIKKRREKEGNFSVEYCWTLTISSHDDEGCDPGAWSYISRRKSLSLGERLLSPICRKWCFRLIILREESSAWIFNDILLLYNSNPILRISFWFNHGDQNIKAALMQVSDSFGMKRIPRECEIFFQIIRIEPSSVEWRNHSRESMRCQFELKKNESWIMIRICTDSNGIDFIP